MKRTNIFLLLLLILLLSACVTQKEYNDLRDENSKLRAELTRSNEEGVDRKELEARANQLQSTYENALKDCDKLKIENTALKSNIDKLRTQYNELEKQFAGNVAGSDKQLQDLLKELQDRESAVAKSEAALKEKSQKLEELENMLSAQNQRIKDMKESIHNALVDFSSDDLQVEEREGRIHLLLSEKLMFKTGKWNVDPKGQQALKSVADVLAKTEDFDILVEGHTDNVPLTGLGEVKDNWDLSVMRATAVAKILLLNSNLDASRVVPCGRADIDPIASNSTTEGKAKNRRTEVILSPNLNKVMSIISEQ